MTTVLAMSFGFDVALVLGLVFYLGALVALRALLAVAPVAAVTAD
jgi:hypothetical protein